MQIKKGTFAFWLSMFLVSCAGGSSTGESVPQTTASAPAIQAISPQDGAVEIPFDAQIYAGFNVPINTESLILSTAGNSNSFIVYPTEKAADPFFGRILGTVTYDAKTQVAIFTPNSPMIEKTNYTVSLGAELFNSAQGNFEDNTDIMAANGEILEPFSWTFTTKDFTAPLVRSTKPGDGSSKANPFGPILINYDEPLDPASVTAAGIFELVNTADPTTLLSGTVSYVDGSTQVAFQPDNPLFLLNTYQMTIHPGIADIFGNVTATPFTFQFATPGTLAVSMSTPQDQDTNVILDTSISVTFNYPMDSATITPSTFTVSDGVNALSGSISFANGDQTATFTPDTNLLPFTTYTVTLDPAIMDSIGRSLGVLTTYTFTTSDRVPAWQTAFSIDSGLNQTDSTTYRIAQGANGATFAIWKKGGSVFANRMPYGGNWGTPTVINQTSDGPLILGVDIGVDGSGNALAVWIQGTSLTTSTNPTRALALKYNAASGLWQTPSQRVIIAGWIVPPFVAYPVLAPLKIAMNSSGYALIGCQRFNIANSNISIRGVLFSPLPSFSAGTFAEKEIRIDEVGIPDNLQIVVDSAQSNPKGIAIWSQSGSKPGTHVFVNRFSNNTWLAVSPFQPLDIASDEVVVNSLQMKMDAEGNAIAVWAQGPASARDLYGAYYDGSNWDATTLLEDQTNDAQFPQITMNQTAPGDGIVVWEQFDSSANANNIYYNKFSLSSGSWMPAGIKITGYDPNQAALPAVATFNSSGDAIAVWREKTTASSVWQIFASEFNSATSTWAASVNVTSDMLNQADLSNNAPPLIISALNRDSVIIWSQTAGGGTYNLWANIFR